jgi:hypothetical protein
MNAIAAPIMTTWTARIWSASLRRFAIAPNSTRKFFQALMPTRRG